jgi:hypothetical protein
MRLTTGMKAAHSARMSSTDLREQKQTHRESLQASYWRQEKMTRTQLPSQKNSLTQSGKK